MSLTQLSRPFDDDIMADDAAFDVQESQMDIHLRRAVARMTQFCNQSDIHARFMAKGLILDTMGDVDAQIRSYFPSYIDVGPVLEDIGFVTGRAAKKSGQQYQEVSLTYIGDGKIPHQEEANKQFFVKWYSDEIASPGGDFDGLTKTLHPGYSGGAGGSGADMLRHLNLANKKGFLLVVSAVDADDIRVMELIGSAGVAQAFGGTQGAVEALKDMLMAGGAQAAAAEAVIASMIEVKSLKQALVNAKTPQQTTAITTALAIKTEALSVALPVMAAKMPAVVMRAVTGQIDAVKADLTASQMARAIERIAASPLPQTHIVTAKVARAVEGLKATAASNGIKLSDMIALTISNSAPKNIAEQVKGFATLMARTEVLPAIERSVPAAAAQAIRADLLTPALARASAMKIEPAGVVQQLQGVAASVNLPVLNETVTRLSAAVPAPAANEASFTQAVVQPMQVQAVVENLQAMQQSHNVPAEVKTQLEVIVPQVEAVAVQMRMDAPAPASQIALNPANDVTPVQVTPVQVVPAAQENAVSALQTLAQETQNPTVQQALEAVHNAAPENRAAVLQQVADNLQAVALSSHTPPEAKASIAHAVEAIQASLPASTQVVTPPRAPVAVPTESPLAVLTDNKARFVSPAPIPGQAHVASPVAALPVTELKKATTAAEASKPPVDDGPGCGTKKCATCFNKTCQATANMFEDMVADLEAKAAPKPKMA